jgi:hypothetical protein
MNQSKILYYYKLISKNEQISEEILKSLPDLDPTLYTEFETIDINDQFYIAEIKKLELPPDFVEAVYCLSEKELWDCYRYNTFKPFKRLPLLKMNPKFKKPLPKLLRIHKGYDYKNFIYKNRDHLLYLNNRIELLQNLQFTTSDEALQIIEKYKSELLIMEEEDQLQKQQDQDQEQEQEQEQMFEDNEYYKKLEEEDEKERKDENKRYRRITMR